MSVTPNLVFALLILAIAVLITTSEQVQQQQQQATSYSDGEPVKRNKPLPFKWGKRTPSAHVISRAELTEKCMELVRKIMDQSVEVDATRMPALNALLEKCVKVVERAVHNQNESDTSESENSSSSSSDRSNSGESMEKKKRKRSSTDHITFKKSGKRGGNLPFRWG